MSGVEVRLNAQSAPGSRIASVRIGHRPVADGATYTLAVSNYLAEGGDGLAILTDLPRVDTRVTTLDALIWHLQAAAQPFVFPAGARVSSDRLF